MKKSFNTLYYTQLSLLSAIIIIMSIVPFLGYIPLGFMNATIIHVPVVIGAIVLGPKAGGILGFVFGITSLINNTIRPNATSFVFTPFYTLGEGGSNYFSLLICLLPRILIGVFAGYIFIFGVKFLRSKFAASVCAGIVGSLTNTILVMLGIFFFFGEDYSTARGIQYDELFSVIAGIIGSVGVIEAIVCAILAAIVSTPLLKMIKKY